MGARFLIDVIPIVPGWHIFTNQGKYDSIMVRGAGPSWSSDIVLMINGSPLQAIGGALRLLSIENAQRIEFVSSASSASYGEYAVSGVINILTRSADEIDGLEAIVRGGSNDTRQTDILFGKSIGDLGLTANFNFFETNGYKGNVEADAQTALDAAFGTDASLAPGDIKGDADRYDVQLSLAFKGLTLEGRYYNHTYEFPMGMRNILDESSEIDWEYYCLNLSYDVDLTEGLNLVTTINKRSFEFEQYSQIFPRGAVVGTPGGVTILPEPLFQEWTGKYDLTRFETQVTYDITETHTVAVGFSYLETEVSDYNFSGNYIPTANPRVIVPTPSSQDWPDESNWSHMPFERTVKAVFIEDVLDAAESLRINLGLRYDHFSDFGEEFSPRAGLNWEFVDNYFLKLNYGRAFRAPIYNELYSPTTGNSDIEPETTDSYELGLAARFWPAVNWQVTYFYRERNDFITLVDGVQQNVGKVINRGVEAQLKYDFSRGSYLSLNYTHIDPEECPYYQPERMGAVVANWRLNKYLNWNAHCLYRGGWRRQEEDLRDDLDDYTIVNTKLTVRQFLPGFDGLELGLSVFNLFDEEYYEPSTYNQGLPGDFPLPGRNFLVELRYTY
jgi:iron complex outermembrane receptor protein